MRFAKKRKFLAIVLTLVLSLGIFAGVFFCRETVKAEAATKPAKPVISLETAKDDTAVKVTIEATSGAKGYRIYMKAESDTKYKKVKTVKKDGTAVRSVTITGLSVGKYSFKVKAYSKASGKTVWGSYSKAKSITLKTTGTDAGSTDASGFSKAKTGDIVVFGSHEQDNNTKNGKEPIEWIVLSNDGKELFVLSKYALGCQPYNTNFTDITWEECSLRKWLNNDFYNSAFSASDKNLIKTTKIKNNDNPVYGTEYGSKGGNDTKDNVFLMSYEDMINTAYGFSSDCFEYDIARRCAPTAYAVKQGVYVVDASWGEDYQTSDGEVACGWWLRSPGYLATGACSVNDYGQVGYDGMNVVPYDGIGVRPALYISLE